VLVAVRTGSSGAVMSKELEKAGLLAALVSDVSVAMQVRIVSKA
jgi:hypothetical protein